MVTPRAGLPEALPARGAVRPARASPASLIIGLLVVLAVFAPWIAPYPEQGEGESNVPARMLPPSLDHLFGTDGLGRDMLSRVIFGARPALVVSLLVVGLAMLIGVPLGALAGYRRGRVDAADHARDRPVPRVPAAPPRDGDRRGARPGPRSTRRMALAISWWPWYARLARGTATSLRERSFVEAARSIGVSDATILRRHIIPNSLTPILVQANDRHRHRHPRGRVPGVPGSWCLAAHPGLGARWWPRAVRTSSTSGGCPGSRASRSSSSSSRSTSSATCCWTCWIPRGTK